MNLALCVATMRSKSDSLDALDSLPGDIPSFTANATSLDILNHVYIVRNTAEKNLGVVGSYQELYTQTQEDKEDILCYVHDDVVCKERGWDGRVLKEFEDPAVAIVGFGGARWHGVPEMYKVPYVLQQLRRGDYLSNVDDAEVHGKRFAGVCDIAVLDGFAMAVRRGFLERIGGFSTLATHCDFFCYDYAMCALVRRHGFRIRLVGVQCHHRGGSTSVANKDAVKEIVGQAAYDASHKWFYEEFRDVMPAVVTR